MTITLPKRMPSLPTEAYSYCEIVQDCETPLKPLFRAVGRNGLSSRNLSRTISFDRLLRLCVKILKFDNEV